MRKDLLLGSIVALSVAAPAMAEDGFDYTYVEAGYVKSDIDDLDIDGDGFGLRGSLEVTQNVHVFASYSDQSFDFDVDAKTFEVGAGFAWPVSSNLDVVGTLSYVKAELDLNVPFVGDLEDDGVGVGAGLRGRPLQQLELTGGLKYVNLDDSGDNTSVYAGARYFFTKAFAIGADVDYDDDATTWMLGARLSFGE